MRQIAAAVLLWTLLVCGAPHARAQDSNIGDALRQKNPLSTRMDPSCPAYGRSPKSDPDFYRRRPADLTPVGIWYPVFAGSLLFTIACYMLRRRYRRMAKSAERRAAM